VREQTCLFCGGSVGPEHLQFCDGRQGAIESKFGARPVLDSVEAKRVTEAGVAQSRDASPEAWREEMRLALHAVARRMQYITSDDLWAHVGAEAMRQANPSALGSVFRSVARDGAIEITDERRESQRPAHHRKPLRVWRSRVCEPVGSEQ